jgi:hypothetical protein
MKQAIVPLLAALAAVPAFVQAQSGGRRDDVPILLHPGALAQMIDELGGHEISLLRAKVVSVLNPQALLVESAGSLEPARGFLNRVIVLIQGGTIRLAPRTLVGTTVRVTGRARTVHGIQVSREVAWPPELTADVVRRYEIRAAILTSAVSTSDGVGLVTPHVAAPSDPVDTR